MDRNTAADLSNDCPEFDELSRIQLFKGLAFDSIFDLLKECPVDELKPDEILFSPEQSKHVMYLVLAGRLRIHADSVKSKPIAVIETGESVGEVSLFDQKPLSMYVVTDSPCRLLVVNKDIFWSLVNSSEGLARNMLFTLGKRLRSNNSLASEGLKKQQQFQRHSHIDSLTGLRNRQWLSEALNRQIEHCDATGRTFSLAIVGIDEFDQFNENFGEKTGDHVIYAVAQLILNIVRPTDIAVRDTGGRFIIVLPNTDLTGAKIAAERVRNAVSHADMVLPDGCLLPAMTISLGVAQLQPLQTPDMILSVATQALFLAQDGGGNTVE